MRFSEIALLKNQRMDHLSDAIKLINDAEAVAIFAGSGMSVESGLAPFRGKDGLWTKSIVLDDKMYDYMDLMSHHAFIENPKEAWGFILSLKEKYENTSPHVGYNKLLEKLDSKDYFIVTSNIDEHFLKVGFDENRIFECHGTINYMQCLDILEREIWTTPNFNKLDLESSIYPKCPNCGGFCRPNILLFGDWFWITTRSVHQQIRYQNWCKEVKASNKEVVVIEIGAGKTINTIRKASENLAKDNQLIRVNPFDFEVNEPNHISIPMNAGDFLKLI
jgi:NAD-dependent SIR2 family protein deacetylase